MGAETDDGAQTGNDRRHQSALADDDGVNGITLHSVNGCNQSLTPAADVRADKSLGGVDRDNCETYGSTDWTCTARTETSATDVNRRQTQH